MLVFAVKGVCMSKMMRLSDAVEKQLEELIALTGKPRQKILEKALKELSKQLFFKKSNEQYLALRKNKEEWNSYMQENEDWDITLQDGLDDE